jgi:aminopeptidase-like protein
MHALVERLYPLCRSITGDGVRATLDIVGELIPLTVHEVPSGTEVFDWTVPREWNIRDAYLANADGERVVDFRESNLHVVSYSVPVSATMPLHALRKHLHTLPEQPDLIPYRTSYYAEDWGFCLPHARLESLADGEYRAVIDSTLADGSLTYAEHVVPGEVTDEVIVSCHVCHPSLANDNLAGIAVATELALRLAGKRPRYTYRFLFLPGTIGSITWLARNADRVERIRHGLVLACAGDRGSLTYKLSRRGDAEIDRATRHVLATSDRPHQVVDFSPYGYDERQYCSPGFNLGVGLFQRSQFGTFPEYHTSADNLDFIRPEHLASSYRMIAAALDVVENDWLPVSTSPKCEPQLGRRGLYSALGGDRDGPAKSMAFLWILNLADGQHTLLDIAERAQLPFGVVADAAHLLRKNGLIVEDRCGAGPTIEA